MVERLKQRFHDFGPFRVDASRRLLLRDGDPVALTPKAFDILMVLLRNADRIVEKDELMKLVWHNTVVEENNLTRNVSSLRAWPLLLEQARCARLAAWPFLFSTSN